MVFTRASQIFWDHLHFFQNVQDHLLVAVSVRQLEVILQLVDSKGFPSRNGFTAKRKTALVFSGTGLFFGQFSGERKVVDLPEN